MLERKDEIMEYSGWMPEGDKLSSKQHRSPVEHRRNSTLNRQQHTALFSMDNLNIVYSTWKNITLFYPILQYIKSKVNFACISVVVRYVHSITLIFLSH